MNLLDDFSLLFNQLGLTIIFLLDKRLLRLLFPEIIIFYYCDVLQPIRGEKRHLEKGNNCIFNFFPPSQAALVLYADEVGVPGITMGCSSHIGSREFLALGVVAF